MNGFEWTIIIACGIGLLAALVLTMRRKTLGIHKLAVIAMLIAVYVLLNMVGTINLWWIRISVDSLPIILGAFLFGPAGGLLVGLLGSLLGQMISYGLTVTTVLWVTPAAVRGLLIGLYARRHGGDLSRRQLCFILLSTALLVTALNTGVMYLDSVIMGYYSYAYVFGGIVTRVIAGAATAAVMVVLAPPVLWGLRYVLLSVGEGEEGLI